MVRISDILKNMGGEEHSRKPLSRSAEKKEEEKEEPSSEKTTPLKFRNEVIPTTQLNAETSEALYQRLLGFTITEIFGKMKEGHEPADAGMIQRAIDPMIENLGKGDVSLLFIAATHSTDDYYLHAHAVNDCIFTIWLAIGLRYPREVINSLALSALLHDLGMIRVMEIAQRPSRFSEGEYHSIKDHPLFTIELLRKIKGLPGECVEFCKIVHERYSGVGYPAGLEGAQLGEEGQCLALCDVYEALTHRRSYRDRFSPHDALKGILQAKDLFHPRVLKQFVQQITVYPIGGWVELSTAEQGQVVATRAALPLRPTIKVYFDNRRKKVTVPKLVDLSKHATLYVKHALRDNEVHLNEPHSS